MFRYFKLQLFLVLLCSSTSVFAQTATQDFQKGQQAFEQGDSWQAIAEYRRALDINPHYFDALQGMAQAYFSLGTYEEASRYVEKALHLGRLSVSLRLLRGRILLGQGKLEEALAIFRDVQAQDPQNRGARFGIAEYEVMKGRLGYAGRLFNQLRREDPSDLRAELSVMYLAEEQNDQLTFEQAFQDALEYHSANALVHEAAARFAYHNGDPQRALKELDQAIALNPHSPALWQFQAQLYLGDNRDSRAIQILDEKVLKGEGAKNPQAWYLRALAEEALEHVSEALSAFRMALRFAPDNETYRFALEDLLRRKTAPDSSLRQDEAQFHFQKARALEDQNYDTQALAEYRRGLLVAPLDISAREARANLFQQAGWATSSLQELETVAHLHPEYKKVSFLDQLEIQKSLYDQGLPAQWGLTLQDLDALDSTGTSNFYRPFRLGLYYAPMSSRTDSYRGEVFLAEDFADELTASRMLDLEPSQDGRRARAVSGFNQAFARSREAGQEFFILLTVKEGQRDFSAVARLCLTRTGRTVQEFSIYKKGLEPDTKGLYDLAQQVISDFPLRGSILQRQDEKALVNLGTRDGVTVGQSYEVLRNGAGEFTGDASWISVNDEDKLGTWDVTAASDWVSEGKLKKSGFFDTIAPGDEVILVPPAQANPLPPPLPVSARLQRALLGLRG